MWFSTVMIRTAMARTLSYFEFFRDKDVAFGNDLMARSKRAKPNVICEPKAYRKASMKSYRSALQAEQYLLRISQRIVVAYFPQACYIS